jgi:hypothetical protein
MFQGFRRSRQGRLERIAGRSDPRRGEHRSLLGLPFLGLGISLTVPGASKTRLPARAGSGRRSGRRNRSVRSESRPPGHYALP